MNIDHPPSGDTGDPIAQALEHIEKAEHDLEKAHEGEREAEKELHQAERELEEAQHRTETEIIVNARPREVPGHTVTFECVSACNFYSAVFSCISLILYKLMDFVPIGHRRRKLTPCARIYRVVLIH